MAAQYNLSALSAGLLLYDLLKDSQELRQAGCKKVFPVVSEAGAELPYICYRRGSTDWRAVKDGSPANTTTMEIGCFANTYAESVHLAEVVRELLDGTQVTYTDGTDTLRARSIALVDSEESWQDDAYMQMLNFEFKIN